VTACNCPQKPTDTTCWHSYWLAVIKSALQYFARDVAKYIEWRHVYGRQCSKCFLMAFLKSLDW